MPAEKTRKTHTPKTVAELVRDAEIAKARVEKAEAQDADDKASAAFDALCVKLAKEDTGPTTPEIELAVVAFKARVALSRATRRLKELAAAAPPAGEAKP